MDSSGNTYVHNWVLTLESSRELLLLDLNHQIS